MQKLIEIDNREYFKKRRRLKNTLQLLISFWFGTVAKSENESGCTYVMHRCCYFKSVVRRESVYCVVVDIH